MVRVYDLAHSRAGDKGDTSNISVIAYDSAAWEILRAQLTPEVVMQAFAHVAKGPVRRYELPKLQALNFVIERALGGGVTRSLAQDVHGKSLSSLMLTIELPGRDAANDAPAAQPPTSVAG
jgi:hypothetical protein